MLIVGSTAVMGLWNEAFGGSNAPLERPNAPFGGSNASLERPNASFGGSNAPFERPNVPFDGPNAAFCGLNPASRGPDSASDECNAPPSGANPAQPIFPHTWLRRCSANARHSAGKEGSECSASRSEGAYRVPLIPPQRSMFRASHSAPKERRKVATGERSRPWIAMPTNDSAPEVRRR